MKQFLRTTLAAVASAVTLAGTAAAQTSESSTVTYQVQALNAMNLDNEATAASLVISSITAGSATATKVDSTTHTFDVSTNQTGTKVSAVIAGATPTNMPAGTSLTIKIGTGTAATISTTSADLLTLTKEALDNAKVYYTLTANVSAGVVASTTKTITYTLTAGT